MPKFDLLIDPPLMNAAGSLGFAPNARGPVELSSLGAFITNPVSLKARLPAFTPQTLSTPGGFLLHTGYPNPGLEKVIRRYAPAWARSPVPILLHLLCQGIDEIRPFVSRLDGLAGLGGLELGIPPDADASQTREMTQSLLAAAAGEFPVLVRLPMERAALLALHLVDLDLAGISLGPPRGVLLGPQGQMIRGRLFGPMIYPLALAAVRDLIHLGLPVIAGGGIYQPSQVHEMLAAGATAVQLDAVLWRNRWPGG